MRFRRFAYGRGWFSTVRVPVPVVSIGNLTVGGSGKTPLVILLCQQFSSHRVAILARGYAARVGEWSDELRVIRRHLPQAMLYQGADRVKLALQAVQDGAELIVLDDAFQHLRLKRDWDLVLVRPEDAQDRVLPSGALREPFSALTKADVVFSYAPLDVAVELKAVPVAPPHLAGTRVALFSGIGNPERFRKTVESLGAIVVDELRLADHEPVSARRLKRFAKRSEFNYLLCTEKDFVKLPPEAPPVVCISIEARLARPDARWQKLIAQIKQRLDNPSSL